MCTTSTSTHVGARPGTARLLCGRHTAAVCMPQPDCQCHTLHHLGGQGGGPPPQPLGPLREGGGQSPPTPGPMYRGQAGSLRGLPLPACDPYLLPPPPGVG